MVESIITQLMTDTGMDVDDDLAGQVADIIENDDTGEYKSLFEDIVDWHDEDYSPVRGKQGRALNTNYVPASPNRLRHLHTKGILVKSYDSNSKTIYNPVEWECPDCGNVNHTRERESRFKIKCVDCESVHKYKEVDNRVDSIRRGLSIAEKGGTDSTEVKEFEPDTPPEALFTEIIGYDEIKTRFRRTIRSRSVRQSILLRGPRASAKTIFLRDVFSVGNVARISGASLSAAGFEDIVIERPAFIIIDEFDEIPDPQVYSVLLNYMDPAMPYTISKSGKEDTIDVETKAPIFASANNIEPIPEPNVDRFWYFEFQRYTNNEFTDICMELLPEKFDISPELGKYIADALREWDDDTSIRDAERIAEVVTTKAEVEAELNVLDKYRSGDIDYL